MANIKVRKGNRCRGAVAAEAALVFPVILLVTFGAIRYGWFFLRLQQITNAARCGARTAALYNVEPGKPMEIISTLHGPYGAKIIEEGENIEDDTGLKVTFTVKDSDGNTSDDVSSASAQDKITVTITVPAADVDILPMDLFSFEPEGWTLGASVTMSKEGLPE
jgi:Flp pilus assembly protein TadG